MRKSIASCVVLLFFCSFLGTTVFGEPPKKSDAPSTSEKQPDNKNAEGANEQAEATDPLAIPEHATPEQLLKFIQRLQHRRPEGSNRQALINDYLKTQRAIVQAAEQVEASQPAASDLAAALSAKFMAIGIMARLGDRQLAPKLLNAVEPVVKMIKHGPADEAQFRMALSLAQALEYSGETRAAADAYRKFADLFANSDNEAIANFASKLQGVARRLNLLGNPITIHGTQLDGTDFDWSQYKGKVVLVDFWATWCGPCVRELPNVKANYEKYHDRGFEVVGISLDDDAEKVRQFLADHEIPWTTLFSADPEHTGWNHPMAEFYGVNAIPTVILVGKDGRVVDLNARGEKLGKLLAELLGPADEPSVDTEG